MKKLVVLAALMAAGVAGHASAAPCPGNGYVFDDVDAASPYCPFITWIATHGVTGGCSVIDPNHRLYCPDAPVTRDQMAAFISRLGGGAFLHGGNQFGAPAKLGTVDNQPLDVYVNDTRALRIEPTPPSIYWGVNPNMIGGQAGNRVKAGVIGATIAGGGGCDPVTGGVCPTPLLHLVTADFGTVGGGFNNTAGYVATVSGGAENVASGEESIVAGGSSNTASGATATVGGGFRNTASGLYATVAGGFSNVASGREATVAGGVLNTAAGAQSFAAGWGANADYDGCFVWGDTSVASAALHCGAPNQVLMRAFGGFVFTTGFLPKGGGYVGTQILPGETAWSVLSDRNAKDNVQPVDGRAVLRQLMAVPVATWNWKTQDPRVRHIGPMAQDFHAAFGLGADDRHISTVDADGVALAAIQGLYRLLEDRDREIAQLKATALRLEGALSAVRARLGLE